MKKLTMMVAAAVLSAALPLVVATETVDGITWTYTVANGTASVGGGYSDSTGLYIAAVPKATSGSITIPSTLGGHPVTSIWNYAFYDCRGLMSVIFKGNALKLGDSVFLS